MEEYKEHIVRNTNKGMTKMREQYNVSVDDASYDNICEAIIEHMIDHQEMYSQGNSFSDSRGRAIKESLGKVANPIGFKDFRSLLTIPENIKFTMDDQAIKNVYLFIAELKLGINVVLLKVRLHLVSSVLMSRLYQSLLMIVHTR